MNPLWQTRPQKLNFFPQKFNEIFRVRRLEERQVELVFHRRVIQHRKLWKNILRIFISAKKHCFRIKKKSINSESLKNIG